jgi:molecular chaperone DnaK (HSP70)
MPRTSLSNFKIPKISRKPGRVPKNVNETLSKLIAKEIVGKDDDEELEVINFTNQVVPEVKKEVPIAVKETSNNLDRQELAALIAEHKLSKQALEEQRAHFEEMKKNFSSEIESIKTNFAKVNETHKKALIKTKIDTAREIKMHNLRL